MDLERKRSKRFIIATIALMLIFFLRGKTQYIDITFQDAVESFNQYEIAIKDFLENPAEEKIPEISQYGGEFAKNHYMLIEHQTFYNKLFKVEPIVTKQEILRLEELDMEMQKLHEKYVSTALNALYMASDFSVLIGKAKENGNYKSDSIDITSGDNHISIIIKGTFRADSTPNILTRYFIIETEQGNYYWEKPYNFSVSSGDGWASLNADKTKYTIKWNAINIETGDLIEG